MTAGDSSMFGYFIFRYKLWRLERAGKRISKLYDADRRQAKEKGAKGEDLERITNSEMSELRWNDEEIMTLHTRRLTPIARALMIEVGGLWDSATKDEWERGDMVYQYMNAKGMKRVRDAIRAEQKARWEMFLMWAPIVGGLTGLVGAITGLIAILSRNPIH
jgi:hypothetical protein